MNEQSIASSNNLSSRIQSAVQSVVRRRIAGEVVPDDVVLSEYAELAEFLPAELAKLRLIEAAERRADALLSTAVSSLASAPTPGRLRIRCPHCREPFETPSDSPLSDFVCESCGGRFCLADSNDEGRRALQQLAHFELDEIIGVGGFGTVWKGYDKELHRTVAVKLPRQERMTTQELEKFLREARAAAQLRHPHIVSVHEVGREGSTVFIVSDYIEGFSLDEWLADQQPTPRQAAELCLTIAEALHHAHNQGVVHRDLKPANILIDRDGRPHITDFGLARRDAGEVTMTMDGQILGTPAYMSPEQAQGDAHAADQRSDVYSLGVILFQLLTGELPFRGNARMLIHQVIHDDPPSPRKLNGNISRDLETITLKCLEKTPRRRFENAEELASELRRYLAGDPVRSRPVSRFERIGRWCHRNRMVATLSAALFTLVAFFAIAGPMAAVRQSGLRRAAERNELLANQSRNEAATAAVEARRQEQLARRRYYASQMTLADEAFRKGELSRALDLLEGQRPVEGVSDLRGFEWFYLWNEMHPQLLARVGQPQWNSTGLDLLANRHELATGGAVRRGDGDRFAECVVNRWDIDRGRLIETITVRGYACANCVRYSRSGKLLAYDCQGSHPHCKIVVRDLDSRRDLWEFASDDQNVRSICWSPDDRFLAAGYGFGNVRIFDVQKGTMSSELEKHEGLVAGLVYSADGRRLYASNGWSVDDQSAPSTTKVYDVTTNPPTKLRERKEVFACDISSDDQRIVGAWGGGDKPKLWDLATDEAKPCCGDYHGAGALTFAQDHAHVVSAGENDRLAIHWLLKGAKPLLHLPHTAGVSALAVDRDRRLWASLASNGEVNVWHFTETQNGAVGTLPIDQRHGNFLAQVLATEGYTLTLEDLESMYPSSRGQNTPITLPHCAMPWTLNSSRTTLACVDNNAAPDVSTIVVYDLVSHRKRYSVDIPQKPGEILFQLELSADGRWLCAAAARHSFLPGARLFDLHANPKSPRIVNGMNIMSVAFSPNGQLIALGGQFGYVFLCDTATGQVVDQFQGFLSGNSWVGSLAFASDGKLLAAGYDDGRIRVWKVTDPKQAGYVPVTSQEPGIAREPMRLLTGLNESVRQIAFFPDGKNLIASSSANAIIWDINEGQERITFRTPSPIKKLQIATDGSAIYALHEDWRETVWREGSRALADAFH